MPLARPGPLAKQSCYLEVNRSMGLDIDQSSAGTAGLPAVVARNQGAKATWQVYFLVPQTRHRHLRDARPLRDKPALRQSRRAVQYELASLQAEAKLAQQRAAVVL